jgi:zinc transporter ZupT
MAKLILPDERPRDQTFPVLLCFGLTLIPALALGAWCRPFTQEHIGLALAAVIAGGFIYWTSSNLLTGIFKSRQGNHRRSEAPIRYWLNTAFIAAGTIMTVWFLIHQSLVVLSAQSP